jgi:quercetin dioxygenase-like cupin family protein
MYDPATLAAPVMRAPHEGEGRAYLGNLMEWRLQGHDTAGAIAMVDVTIRAGGEPLIHVHEREDEVFHVLEGQMTFVCGGRERRANPGATVFLPRGIPHGFRVDTDVARALCIVTPAGLEPSFHAFSEPSPNRELPAPPEHVDAEALVRVLAEHGVTVVGPPPSAPGWGPQLTARLP